MPWRLKDLVQWLFETCRISVSETTVSRELKTLGYAKLSARPRHVAADAHAVLLVDQAGWHMSSNLEVSDNITLVPLPPSRAPELNPVENIWQFMRGNWLSNRVLGSYDDILDHCCQAWNKLADQPWLIMSIGLRQRAHGF